MLTNTTNVDRYLINGTPLSTYAIHFPYWDKEEINVYLTNSDGSLSTLTEGTNYTLSTPNGTNGTLTRVGDWTAGATNLTIIREMSLTQEVDLRNGDKIDAETLETALDNLTAQVQQLAETQSRAVVSSVDEAGSNLAIPNKASRIGSGSGTMMGFGSDGESIVLRDLAQFDADVASAASDASSASASAGTATTQALKSEGYAVGEQNGSPVTSGSPYYENNSKHYAQVAKAGADVITDNLTAITNLDTNMTDINAVADDISNVVAVAGDLTKVDAVADDLTNIDAVNANKTNIDTVAGIASDVTDVAGVASDIPTVAGVSTDISAVATDISDVSAVAGDLVKVKAVADDLTNIDAVNANKTNIDTVAGKASEITTVAGKANDVTTVAGIASNVTTVAGKASEVTTVAGIASDVSAVAQVASDVASVADELTDIGTVASNISDVAAVGADIAKVSAVADDLTSIDAVYADLANIDAADDHALEAEGWAAGTQNGVPVTSGSPYYENNAKYYGQEIPNLKSAIDKNSNRISNLEQEHGGYVTVNYRGTNDVPPNKAKYVLVESIVGKSRAWNNGWKLQGSKVYNSSKLNTAVISGTSISATVKEAGTSQSYNYGFLSGEAVDFIQGHVYLFTFSVYSDADVDKFGVDNGSWIGSAPQIDYTSGTTLVSTMMVTATASQKAEILPRFRGNYAVGNTVRINWMVRRDLTVIFPELTSTDLVTSNIPALVKRCPDLLKYDAYGTSIVDTVVEGVKSEGVNIWDEVWEQGYYDQSTGQPVANTSRIRSKNAIPIKNGETYYALIPSATISVLGYDNNGNYIGVVYDGYQNSFTVSLNGVTKVKIYTGSAYGGNYNHDIQISEVHGSVSTVNTTYHPYMTDTITLPTSVTLRSAGTVADTDELNVAVNGVAKRRQTTRVSIVYDLSELSWGYNSTFGFSYTTDLQNIVKKTTTGTELPSITCTNYNVKSRDTFQPTSQDITMDYSGASQGWILVGGENPTGYIVVALATESVTLLDPIENNTILTEGGGTINTIQDNVYPDDSPAPTIDNCLDVGYLAV